MVYDLTIPSTVEAPWPLSQAEKYCEKLAKSHYENFTVGSLFIPKQLRQHMYNIYAYCRFSDDLGDEVGNPEESLRRLSHWETQLEECYQGRAHHPIFVALQTTIGQFQIPKEPFRRLIQAFKQDQLKTRYATYEELLDYCVNSANPVGHLVLYLFGYSDQHRQKLSDSTCTALQLANFWQDVARDLKIGRVYLPQEDLKRFGVTEFDLARTRASSVFKALMQFEITRTRELFTKGAALVQEVSGVLKIDLKAFTQGGLAVLEGIKSLDYDVLAERPVVSRWKKFEILIRALCQRTRL